MAEADDALTSRARARLGRVLGGKWTLDALLGVGAMAAVYAATHRNGSRVALKLLHPELSTDESLRARFLREGYVANRVGHPAAVRVLDDHAGADGVVFFVMDLLEGETIEARWLRSGRRLPLHELVAVADPLLDALAAAHAQGIVHRDLKPENLFLAIDGALRVLDFGIARLRDPSLGPATATLAGAALGTPAFMSPEQALGREVDARSDLFSVGALAFTLLSGRHVHERSTTNEQLVAAATQPASPVAAALPELDAAFAGWLDRALAFDPDARFASALEMRAALHDVVASLERRGVDARARFDGMPAPLAVQPRPPGDASATRRWAAAAVVLVTAGAIGLATRNALPPPSAATDSPVARVPALDAAPASEPAVSAAMGERAPTTAPSASAEAPPAARRNLRVTAPPRRPPSRTWLDRRD